MNSTPIVATLTRFNADPAAPSLGLLGDWRLPVLSELAAELDVLARSLQTMAGRPVTTSPTASASPAARSPSRLRLDGRALQSIDTAAALLLLRRLRGWGWPIERLDINGLSASQQRILSGVQSRLAASDAAPPARRVGLLASLGVSATLGLQRLGAHVSCLGRTAHALGQVVRRPQRFRGRECLVQLQQTGISAIPVISLVLFLIGAVMAYLLGLQAEQYGANIYVVDGVTLGTVREFAPLLVATVVAGRSGAAFTAQLGTMKLTEETDAIRTLGLSAEQVLLLPRVIALLVVLPLLVFIGSAMALAGASMVCHLMLDITPSTFIERMQSAIGLRHYLIGLFKAPVFALVIAIIGCSMGFTVSRDTRAIGLNTTSTVVQCIVTVVLIDAVFAMVFQTLGW